jgi:hypothetical protein
MLHFHCRDFIQSRTSPFHGLNVSVTIHCGFSAVTSRLIDLYWYVATCTRERIWEIRRNEDQTRSHKWWVGAEPRRKRKDFILPHHFSSCLTLYGYSPLAIIFSHLVLFFLSCFAHDVFHPKQPILHLHCNHRSIRHSQGRVRIDNHFPSRTCNRLARLRLNLTHPKHQPLHLRCNHKSVKTLPESCKVRIHSDFTSTRTFYSCRLWWCSALVLYLSTRRLLAIYRRSTSV